MARWRGICFWLTSVITIVLILIASLYLLVTRAISLEPFKERLIEKLCKNAECQVDFKKLEILLMPAPHIALSQVRISVPGLLSGTVQSLSLFPRILPLFTGRLELSQLRFTSPDMEITVPDAFENERYTGPSSANHEDVPLEAHTPTQDSSTSSQEPSSTSHIQAQGWSVSYWGVRMHWALKILTSKPPGLNLQIERGSIGIRHEARSLILLQELSSDIVLSPDNLSMKIECRSDLWEKLALDGSFDLRESKGKGRIMLNHFQSQILGQYLPSRLPKPAGESPIHLDVSFSSEGPEVFSATFQGSSPSLTLQMGTEESVLKNINLNGLLQVTAGRVDLRLARFDLGDPQLSLSGQFLSVQEPPAVSYHLECKDVDAMAVRKVALALVGESPVVQDIFQIIRGGRVPLVVLEAQGSSTEDLKRGENLLVQGSLQDGEVFIEKINLMVTEAKGDVLISHGILKGKKLQGRAGGSTGRNGSLTVALTKSDGPFHLDIEIDADLAQLPPVLARVVDSKAFLRELALLQDITGRANGRLILGETLSSIQTKVEVNEWILKGKYQRVPFPMELQAQSFFYEGSKVSVESLKGHAGKSKWYDVSGSLDWSRGPVLELAPSTRARISLDEVFPWLMTFPDVRENGWNIESMKGILQIDTLAFQGFLSRPGDWRFLLKGRIEELTSRSGMLSDILTIKSGAIAATQKSLQTANCDLTYLDASLVASGELIGDLKDLQSADFSLYGTIGPQAGEWLSDQIHLPTDLRVRTPLSTPGVRFRWTREAQTTLSGILRVSGGPEISMVVDHDPQRLSINQLTIKDEESDAALTLGIKEAEVDFGFKGNLATGTLDRLFTGSRRFSGSAEGDLSARFIPNQLANSTAHGKLSVRDFLYVLAPGMSLRVENASLEAKGANLEVSTAAFRVMDTSFEIKGNVGVAEEQLQVDLDLLADGMDWDKLKSLSSLNRWGTEHGLGFLETPIRGTVRVNTGYFTYDNTTWKPLRAKLVFARDGISTQVTEANLCSIPTPATIIPSRQGQLLIIKLDGRNLDLDPTLACLWDRKGVITGAFDLQGEIFALLTERNMSQALEGGLDLIARNGRVYRSTVLAKIFDLLNFTEIYRGQLPDLTNEGCAYDSIKAKASLKNGKLLLEHAIFDGRCAKMVGSGEVDLTTRKLNITILVSPLKTVDLLVRNIPLVGGILGGSLVSIPVRVTGDLSSPTVIPLSPSAVGEGLVTYMKRVFQFPLKLMQPLQ
jgi:hypothetical protein